MLATKQLQKLPSIFVTGIGLTLNCNTLFSIFLYSINRNVLEIVHEYHLSSVAIPIIYTVKRGYPPDEGAHLALSNLSTVLLDIIYNL